MNMPEYNDSPKFECISAPVIVHVRVYVTYLFVSIKASSSKWGQSFHLIYTRIGNKFENGHMENSTRWYFFLYMNHEREKKLFSHSQ